MNNRILMPLMLTIILFFLAAAMPSTAFSVSLSATPQEGHAPLTVSYECNAHGGFFPVSYAISFGDGTTSTNNKGTKTYTQPGDYDIKCVAIDGLHFQAEDTKSIIVTQKPPVTTFESITLTANPQKGDSPLTVSYSCSAIGGYEPVSYVMSFGDGSTSTNRQGTKTYTKDGVYTMKCTAIDALHFTISTEKTITVTKPKEPTPFTGMDLNVYPKSGYAPLTVSYSCNAHGGNAPVSYAVSFGDGTTSTNKEGTKTYTQPGNYKITCTAIDALHFQISRSQDVVVKEDKPLMVSLTANPKEGFAPLEVSYTCSASGNSPFSYSIDFGDGTKSTNNVGSKTYNSPGNYKLSCTVTDDKGKTKTVSQSINVKDKPPIIGISFDINPKSGMAPLKTDYECRVLGGVEPISYDIVFGDGTSTSISKGSKTYTQHGSYVATCTAKDAVGQSVSSSVNVDVTKMPPGKPFERIDLLVDPTVGHAPLTVQYSCNAVGGYEPVSYAISFGDGTTSTNKQGSKTYAQPGTYDIKCTAIDALHNQISTKASVTVNPKVSELKSVFTVDPKEGFAPLKVDYHCSASGGLAPYSYSINFGDGTGSNSPVGSHVYDVPGKYKVSCLVMDYSGQSVMKHHYVNVKDKPPMTDMSFSIVPDEGYAPLKTDYHCSVKGGVGPISYHVSFGDGTSVNNNMGSKTYSNPGSYVATCTAKDAVGQTISSQKKVNVLESKDFTGIDFNVHPKEGFAPLTVEYSCSASGGNAPVSYAISFGDGTSSNSKEGTKTYTQPGSYEVKCTAVDVLDNEISKSVFVTVKPKVPELTVSLDANPLQGFAPLEVDYYCSASGGKAPYSYELSFSDGTTSDDNVGSKVYDEPGNYLLSCKVTDSMNNVRVASKNILVNDKPIMSDIVFDVDPTEGVAPLTIEYNCSVQGGVGPISYHINFCDGTSVNNNVGSKTYSNPGVYVAVCTAKDAIGQILIATQEIIVKEKIPVTEVVFDISPKVGDAPLEVQYSCNAVGGTGHITYDIVFGDGTITNSNAGSHVYNNPGVYNAVCTATDSIGQEMSSSIIVTVKEPYDDIDFESITFNVQPQSGFAPLEVSYSCSVVGGNDPVTITMDFGVGSGSTTLGRQTQGVFLYNTPGTYNMRCTAVDNDGDAISSVRTINVFEVDDREWSIMANPLSGNAPLTVRFDADTTEFGNAIVTWDFKTGHKATGNSVIHVFPRPGTYDVTASFLDENSIYRKKSVTITVLRADEKEELVDGGLLIRGFIAEVSGGRLYVTATIISESTTTMNNIRVQLMLPENDIYEAKMIRTLRAGERTSVSFIVPIDNMRIDTFAVLTASSNNAYTRQMRPLMG